MEGAWCVARDGEGLCPAPVAAMKPVPLCRAHQMEVALQVVPGVLAESWGKARAGLRSPEAMINDALPLRVPQILPRSHASVVYFVENGTRVKIGTTTRLAQRLGSLTLRADSIRLLLSGGANLENALHRHFEACRIAKTEWFAASEELITFLRSKQLVGGQGELIEVTTDPAPDEKIDTDQARALVVLHINSLHEQGEAAFEAKSFAPLMPQLTRSRSWLVGELQRLVTAGLLVQAEPGQYLIAAKPPQTEQDAS